MLQASLCLFHNNHCKNTVISPNFHNRKLGEITVFYAVNTIKPCADIKTSKQTQDITYSNITGEWLDDINKVVISATRFF